ncbi:MAG: LLM class flavin-dependent oxidoreductase [Betaproteobacteria bacterium]|nr:LLM class flavin-dependent oxidoreductase [Betaproteobacteria bacterium]MSQ87678.1 LLM class flavin-dependent oxidoreductase [Betaproteobacteria bacterium]
MKLSVLDQSPIISGHSAAQAIEETIKLARRADELGYHRYWLAEHHAIAALADPCPEILLARLGAETKRIRVGTGGVLLPYYSAFKVAEIFRMLEALYPGRIDLGIGRAPGGDQRTARAVGGGHFPDAEQFPQQVWELIGYLDGTLPEDHPNRRVRVQPEGRSAPELWLLGSSDYSGLLAAQLGVRFSFAHFINAQGGDLVTRAYQERFQPRDAHSSGPTPREAQPHSALCCFVICAATDDEAERRARVVDLRRLHMALNQDLPVPTLAEAEQRAFSKEELQYIRGQRPRAIIGSPQTCRDKLLDLAGKFSADELMVLTITGDYATRLESYELLAQAFALAG